MLNSSNAFLKINLPIRQQYIADSKGKLKIGYGDFHYYVLEKPYRIFEPKVFSILRPDFFSYAEILGHNTVLHRDIGTTTNLNIYIEPDGGITEFFRPKEGVNVVNKIVYTEDEENLEKYAEFKAEKFECYLVNAEKIHRITSLISGKRILIQACWRTTPFKEVRERVKAVYETISD